ncbi:hypothetical protein [Thermococcus sp. Bubb.Bath]|uniref:hypothetical protein n=1 Tax=Thermococcus sp. Bubb.Bath TaxID=1638242 RepID=UPI00143928E5|nr:hypothetical protein [Thermococcus sp. Bubb.Bath]NJF24844.1 hypothetical protein [Thermococcus sp. Bubb.Bath]
MEAEEYLLLLGLALAVLALVYPGQTLSGKFCEGSHGKLGDYYVSVSDGFLRVSGEGGDAFVAYGKNVILRRIPLDYSYLPDSGCYNVKIRYKGQAFLYVFAGGLALAGGAFFYMAFLKYR